MLYNEKMRQTAIDQANTALELGFPSTAIPTFRPKCCLAAGHNEAVFAGYMTASDLVQAVDKGDF